MGFNVLRRKAGRHAQDRHALTEMLTSHDLSRYNKLYIQVITAIVASTNGAPTKVCLSGRLCKYHWIHHA